MTNPHLQQGVGVIEVMIALALIMFTAMAVGNMQTSSIVSARVSSIHFSLDILSSEMLETLRAQPDDAESGLLNFDGATTTTEDIPPAVSSWNSRIEEAIPTGLGSISCAAGFCDVSISWIERIDGSTHRQFYRTRTPL